eukprot:6476764-Amphidinium_carterae.2
MDQWRYLGDCNLLPRVVTWNAASLYSRDTSIFRSRLEVVQQIRTHVDILCFQETHCADLDLVHYFEGWSGFHSMHPAGRSTGGVSAYVRKAWMAKLMCNHAPSLNLPQVV